MAELLIVIGIGYACWSLLILGILSGLVERAEMKGVRTPFLRVMVPVLVFLGGPSFWIPWTLANLRHYQREMREYDLMINYVHFYEQLAVLVEIVQYNDDNLTSQERRGERFVCTYNVDNPNVKTKEQYIQHLETVAKLVGHTEQQIRSMRLCLARLKERKT